MTTAPAPRRRFLEMLAGGALVGGSRLGVGCAGYNYAGITSTAGPVDGGNVSALPVGSLVALTTAAVAVGRDQGGIYAMTLYCTHAGCDMASQGSVSAQGVVCHCHGSIFDANGNVLGGPAGAPLEHFAVAVDAAGQITIDTSTTVAASTRTPA